MARPTARKSPHTVLADHFSPARSPVKRTKADRSSRTTTSGTSATFPPARTAKPGPRGSTKHLFAMKEYPRDMIVTYAEGYSVVQFLVDQGGRKKFLEFVASGMKSNSRNWDEACRSIYGYQSVDALEDTWIQSLYKPPARTSPYAIMKNGTLASGATTNPRTEIRSSAAPGLPSSRTGGRPRGVWSRRPIGREGEPDLPTQRPSAGEPPAPPTPTDAEPQDSLAFCHDSMTSVGLAPRSSSTNRNHFVPIHGSRHSRLNRSPNAFAPDLSMWCPSLKDSSGNQSVASDTGTPYSRERVVT